MELKDQLKDMQDVVVGEEVLRRSFGDKDARIAFGDARTDAVAPGTLPHEAIWKVHDDETEGYTIICG